jgi:hypothetical protein
MLCASLLRSSRHVEITGQDSMSKYAQQLINAESSNDPGCRFPPIGPASFNNRHWEVMPPTVT